MGGRGATHDAVRAVINHFGLSEVTDSKSKIIEFYRRVDRRGTKGFEVVDGKMMIGKRTMREARELADQLSQRIVIRDLDAEKDFRDIRKIVSTPHTMSAYDRKDIPDFAAYARSSDNFVRISNRSGGDSVDQLYENLADQYPHYFPRSVYSPSARLERINTVMRDLRDSATPLSGGIREDAARDLTMRILQSYAYRQSRQEKAKAGRFRPGWNKRGA